MASINTQSDWFVRWHNSPADYAEYLRAIPAQYRYNSHDRGSWSGGSFEKNICKLENGDTTNLAAAEQIVSNMQDQLVFARGQHIVAPYVVGFMPHIPNTIAGHPYSMMRRERIDSPSNTSPIRIFVEVIVSAGLNSKQIINRGVACCALAMALSMTRPIELYAVATGMPCSRAIRHKFASGAVVRIDTNPIDLSRAVYMLTDNGFCRRLAFTAMFNEIKENFGSDSIAWPFDKYPSDHISYSQLMRAKLNLEPDDIFVMGGYVHDKALHDNPVAWVKARIAETETLSQSPSPSPSPSL